jgi:hypothetical protein
MTSTLAAAATRQADSAAPSRVAGPASSCFALAALNRFRSAVAICALRTPISAFAAAISACCKDRPVLAREKIESSEKPATTVYATPSRVPGSSSRSPHPVVASEERLALTMGGAARPITALEVVTASDSLKRGAEQRASAHVPNPNVRGRVGVG